MSEFGIIGLVILAATFLVSYKGFKDPAYFDKYAFRVGEILHGRQYYRLLTSGLLHAGWVHLLFNVITFYCFSSAVEMMVGYGNYLLIYVGSLVGGNLFSLLLHRHEKDYTAVGASGAISGLVFAALVVFPGIEVGLVGIYLPGWLYGLLFVLLSAYGIMAQRDNIGHDAHLGGGLVGMFIMLGLRPALLQTNYLVIAAILVPSIALFYWLIRKERNQPRSPLQATNYQTTDDRYQNSLKKQEADLDELLDKINHQGLQSLSAREKKQLEKLSR